MSLPRALELYAKLGYGNEPALRRAYRLVQRIDPREDDFLALFHLAIHGLTFPRLLDGDIRRAIRELGGLYNVSVADVVRRLGCAVDERRVNRVFERMHAENRRSYYAARDRPSRRIRILRKDRPSEPAAWLGEVRDERWLDPPKESGTQAEEVRDQRWSELERRTGELRKDRSSEPDAWLGEVRDQNWSELLPDAQAEDVRQWIELERRASDLDRMEKRRRRFNVRATTVPAPSLLDLPLPTSRQDAEEDPGIDDTAIVRATASQNAAYREQLDRELDRYMAERRKN